MNYLYSAILIVGMLATAIADDIKPGSTDLSDTATKAQGALADTALQPTNTWTPNVLTWASTVTVSQADGNLVELTALGTTTFSMFAAQTGSVSTVRGEFYASTESWTWDTNIIENTDSVTLSTNGWSSVIFDSQRGATNWYATQLQ